MKLAESDYILQFFSDVPQLGHFYPDLGNFCGFLPCDSGKAQGGWFQVPDTWWHPGASCPGSILEHHLLACPPGTPRASATPKVIFFPSNKSCSCKTGVLLALKLGRTTKSKGCSVTFPSAAEHLHSRSGVQGPTPHSPILKNKLFPAWKSRQRAALLGQGQGCRLHFNFACNRWFSLIPKDLLLLLSECLPSTPVRKWSRKYFPEVFLVLLFSYAFCLSVCLCANISWCIFASSNDFGAARERGKSISRWAGQSGN